MALDFIGQVQAIPIKGQDPPCSGKAQASVARALDELRNGKGNVYLNSCDLSDAGTALLIKGLAGVSGLKTLNLACNGITDTGAVRIAEAMSQHPALEVLALAQNHIGDTGMKALAQALEVHPRLRMLGLEGNNVGDRGSAALVTALASAARTDVMASLATNPVRRFDAAALESPQAVAVTVKSLSRVGVTLGQLLPFFKEHCDSGKIDPWKTTTNEVVHSLVLPSTARSGASFVEAGGHKNVYPTTHVVHAWTGIFQDLLKAIAMHASGKAEPSLDPSNDLWRYDPEFLEKSYFIDAFCCNQHSCTNRIRHCGLVDGAAYSSGDPRCQIDKFDLVAEQISRRGGRVLVAVDSKMRVLSRLACLCEIRQSILDGLVMEANFISIQETYGALTNKAEACSEKARLEMLEAISIGPGGTESFNRQIVEFINAQVAIKWKEKVEGKKR